MKIIKNASGKQTVKLSKCDWENFGKKAGWLDESGKLIVKAEGVDMEREASPAPAAPPRTKPGRTKPGRTKPGRRERPEKFDPMKPKKRNPGVPDPAPKAEEEDIAASTDEELVEAEVSPDNLPTIASELKKKLKISGSFLEFKRSKDPYYNAALKFSADFQKTHQSSRDFWENMSEEHLFSKFPFLAKYGHQLSESNWKYITDSIEKRQEEIQSDANILQIITLSRMIDIAEIEAGHHEELCEISKQLVSDLWGVDPDILNAQFKDEPGTQKEEERQHEVEEEVEITPELRDEINKRVLLNALMHGASLNAMMSMHHMAGDKIKEVISDGKTGQISDGLKNMKKQVDQAKQILERMGVYVNLDLKNESILDKYTKFSELVLQHYYHMDFDMLKNMEENINETAIGESKIKTPQENENGTEEETSVTAKGMVFPVICQELVKGIIEVISTNGINEELNPDQIKTIYNQADKLEYEPWLIMVGPQIWRNLLASKPEGLDHGQLLGRLSREPTEEFFKILEDSVDNPEALTEKLDKYLEDLKEEEKEIAEWEEEEAKAKFEEDEIEEGEFEEIGEFGKNPNLDEFKELDHEDLEGVDMEKELASLFGNPKREPMNQPKRHPEEDLPPIEFDDDDDLDKPYWMN